MVTSWEERKTLFGGPYHLLSCYSDAELHENKARLETEPHDCLAKSECCLKPMLIQSRNKVAKVRSALKDVEARPEVSHRQKVLRQLEKHPTNLMTRKECRRFGDAYFVLFCPTDAVIVTTNVRDIEPMASELGISVDRPAKPLPA